MNRKSTTNYSNRTVDALLLQFVDAPKEDILVEPDISRKPRIVTGIEKLVQRFALLFLTDIGSVKNRDGEGTEFMPALLTGRIYNENTLRAEAVSATKSVIRQIKIEDAALETAPDEALDNAEVTDVRMDRARSSVSVTVKIESTAGEQFVYTIPLDTGV